MYCSDYVDVSPHLVYKNGQLWPQDVPFPSEKDQPFDNSEVQCFSPESVNQFPAYFKDAKGSELFVNEELFCSVNSRLIGKEAFVYNPL